MDDYQATFTGSLLAETYVVENNKEIEAEDSKKDYQIGTKIYTKRTYQGFQKRR